MFLLQKSVGHNTFITPCTYAMPTDTIKMRHDINLFQQSASGLDSGFSFSYTGNSPKTKDPSLPYTIILELMDLFLFKEF